MMKIEIIYVYSNEIDAARFIESFHARPPGADYTFCLVLNRQPGKEGKVLKLMSDRVVQHDNSGWDVGAYQAAADCSQADLCLFLGSHTYFQFPYWLRRMVTVAQSHGLENLYGAFATSLVQPHIRTTAFWCNPKLFREIYPERVRCTNSGGDRYEFEHGERSLTTRWLLAEGHPGLAASRRKAFLVTWDDVYPPERWLDLRELQWWPPSQKNLLLRDKQVDLYRDYGRCPATGVGPPGEEPRCEFAVDHAGRHFALRSFF